MTQRISIGPKGEFFIEANEAISAEQLPIIERLYRMILTARVEIGILMNATEAMDEGD